MADERENQDLNPAPAAKEGHIQSRGRRHNAAQPLATRDDKKAGADRYPDAPENRSFEPKLRNETAAASVSEGPPAGRRNSLTP